MGFGPMLMSYLKVALRVIGRHKFYTLINILGLASGMLTCILIGLWVRSELSFDRFHRHADQIWRVTNEITLGEMFRPSATTMGPLVPAMIERFPDVMGGTTTRSAGRVSLKLDARSAEADELIYARESFFEVFSFRLREGESREVLKRPYTIVLTASLAESMFGQDRAVGRFVRVDDSFDCEITGIAADPPSHSHFRFDAIVSYETYRRESEGTADQWGRMGHYSYLRLQPQTDIARLETGVTEMVNEHLGPALESRGGRIELHLQPLTDIHLYSDLNSEFGENGSIQSVALFSAIALLALLMAGFNFTSLTLARSGTRAVEAAIRRTMGARRSDLFLQTLLESTIVFCIAAVIAAAAAAGILPAFQLWLGRDLKAFDQTSVTFIVIAGASLSAILGLAPALRIASVPVARSTAVKRRGGSIGKYIRRGLVLVQFLISTGLIIAALVIHNQMAFLHNKDLGFTRDPLLVFDNFGEADYSTLQTLRAELGQTPGVQHAALASGAPIIGPFPLTPYETAGSAPSNSELLVTFACDEHFTNTLGLNVIAGRGFRSNRQADSIEAVLVNETAVERFGWDAPVGRLLRTTQPSPEGPIELVKRVVGVVEDFHFKTLHDAIEPVVITRAPVIALHDYDHLIVRLEPNATDDVYSRLESIWNQVLPNHPFAFTSMDQALDAVYARDARMAQLVQWFGLLAISIGILGLLGMVAYASEQRKKEIGVRKAFGASTGDIVRLLMTESVLLALAASIMAVPPTLYLVRSWLSGYAYSATPGLGIFVIAGVVSIATAIGATGYHSVKAGLTKPIDAIRYE